MVDKDIDMSTGHGIALTGSSTAGIIPDTGEGHEVSDVKLVQRTQGGDTEAFSELVRRHQVMVYNLSYRFMRDATQAEDMAQESFFKGYRLLKGFKGQCRFSTWMYRVTSSVCLTELNRRKRRHEVPLEACHFAEHHTQSSDSQDMPEHIRRCVGLLPERYATIVTLYYLDGVAYEEIAAALEIPMGTLKTWMFRARKKLKKIVERELYSDAC
jgi:RNA polymerase sigma-70 factor (ECF subfamily)